MQNCRLGGFHKIVKGTIYVFLICLILLNIIAVNAQENSANPKFIVIDEMRTLDGWNLLPNGNNSSVDISLAKNGLDISYDLKKPYSWVDISKEIDFAKIIEAAHVSGIDKLVFYYEGNGSPNSFEIKLEYNDTQIKPATFGFKRSAATNTNGIFDSFFLNPWQITYWWDGIGHAKNEPVDFSKVKKLRFAVSNNPKSDTLGKGYVIIKNITAETIPLEQPSTPQPGIVEQHKEIIVALIGLIGVLIVGLKKVQDKK